jgi:AcrR family transcriptional regulator
MRLYDSNERMIQANDQARDTKDRILDAAEARFADQGFAATSLRQITRDAGVNLASVNYHFQTKEALLLAVLRRKIEPVNQRRLMLLDALEAQLPRRVPAIDELIRTFFRPVFEAHLLGIRLGPFPRLMGRVMTEPGGWAQSLARELLGPVLDRFVLAFRRAEPALTSSDLAWGMLFTAGAMAHLLAGNAVVESLTGKGVDRDDTEEALDRLVAFVSAGMRAMASGKEMHA